MDDFHGVLSELFPSQFTRAVETLLSAPVLILLVACTLTYYSIAFFWQGAQLLLWLIARLPQKHWISPIWQIAALAFLAANLNLRLIIAG